MTSSPTLYPVNGASVLVIHTFAAACTAHVAVAELFPVVYSALAVAADAIWLNAVPIAEFCVIGALKSIVILSPGFKLLR